MANCVLTDVNKSPDKRLAYQQLSQEEKEQMILQLLSANRGFLANSLSKVSNVFTVKIDPKTSETFIEYKLSNAALKEIKSQQWAMLDEEVMGKETEDRQKLLEADKESIEKSAVTKVVNFLLGGFPMLEELSTTVSDFRAVNTMNPARVTQTVWRLLQKHPIYTNTEQGMRDFLSGSVGVAENTHIDNMAMASLHNMLFAERPFVVNGPGFNRTYHSYKYLSQNSPDPEIRERSGDILSLFLSYFESARMADMVHADKDNTFTPDPSAFKEEKNRMNKGIFYNIFNAAIDTSSDTQSISLNPVVIESLEANKVAVIGNNVTGFTMSYSGKVIPFKINHSRFKINHSRRENLINADQSFVDNFDMALVKNMLYNSGYKENVLDMAILDEYVNKKSNDSDAKIAKSKKELADLALSAVFVTAFNADIDNFRNGDPLMFFDNNILLLGGEGIQGKYDQYSSVAMIMAKKYGYNSASPLNHKMLIEKLFPGFRSNKAITFIYSPTAFFVGNEKIAKQVVETVGMLDARTVKNINEDTVNRFAIQSSVFKLRKLVGEIERTPESVFRNNPMVTAYSMTDFYILDGYKTDSISKGHMDMDNFEFNTTVKRFFIDSITDSFIEGNTSQEAVLPVAVFSDKTAFIPMRVHALSSGKGFLPMKATPEGQQVDVSTLLQKGFEHFDAQRVDAIDSFLSEWVNAELRADMINFLPIELQAEALRHANNIEMIVGQRGVDGLARFNALNDYLKMNVVPAEWNTVSGKETMPFNLTSELHYTTAKNADPVGIITKKMAIKEEVSKYFNTTPEQYTVNLLNDLATSHRENKKIGFKYSQSQKNFIDDFNFYIAPETDLVYSPNATIDERIMTAELAMDPFHLAYFFAYNDVTINTQKLLFGQVFQYKGSSIHDMQTAQLKRSIAGVAPFTIPSVDPVGDIPYRLPQKSYTLHVHDTKLNRDLINGSETAEPTDGMALINILATKHLQSSLGGVHGLYPKSAVKLINLDMQVKHGVQQMYKYAAKEVSRAMYNMGNDKLRRAFEIMIDTVPIGWNERISGDVVVDFSFGDKTFGGTYTKDSTLLNILTDLEGQLGGDRFENIDRLYHLINNFYYTSEQGGQPKLILKDKYIDQIVYGSSIKTGQRNVLTENQLFGEIDRTTLIRKLNRIDNNKRGIQLDAIHDPEHKGISLVSQLFSNSVIEGWTFTQTQDLYNTLAKLTNEGAVEVFKNLNGDITIDENSSITLAELRYEGDEDSFNSLDPEEKSNIFIRSLLLNSLEMQGDLSDIYQILMSNPRESFKQNPQTLSKVVSAINSYVNKRTVNPTMEGGHYVLSSGHFFDVYEMAKKPPLYDTLLAEYNKYKPKESFEDFYANQARAEDASSRDFESEPKDIDYYKSLLKDYKSGSTKVVVTRDREAIMASRGYSTIAQRPLAWKGYVRKNAAGEEERFFEVSENWKVYFAKMNEYKKSSKDIIDGFADTGIVNMTAFKALEAETVKLRSVVQKELMDGGWTVTPAEFLMPNVFKKEFGLQAGVQVSDIDTEYFVEQYKRKIVYRKAFHENLKLLTYLDRQTLLDETDMDEVLRVSSEDIDATWDQHIKEELGSDEDIQEIENAIRDIAEKKYQNFKKSLEVVVNRIPSTGMQSVVHGTVVGFVEGDYNVLFVPVELLMIQGADYDIDKGTVLHPAFDKTGNLFTEDNTAKFNTDPEYRKKSLLNSIFYKIKEIISAASNALQSDTAVTLMKLQVIKKEIEAGLHLEGTFNTFVPETLIYMKRLASEGKAMVGVFANGLKTYDLVYYTQKVLRATDPNAKLGTISFYNSKGQTEVYDNVANIDNGAAVGIDQVWKFYSALTNGATDNAKELILGAIGANLQTGNMINAATMYGIDSNELFALLREPFSQDIFTAMLQIGRAYEHGFGSRDIDVLAKQNVTNDLYLKLDNDPRYIQIQQNLGGPDAAAKYINDRIGTLIKLYRSGEEFAVLASTLGINREIPRSMYEKFKFNKRIENFINEKLKPIQENKNEPAQGVFSMDAFMQDMIDLDSNQGVDSAGAYIDMFIAKYENVKTSVNILEVLRTVPHIKANLKVNQSLNTFLKKELPVYDMAESIIQGVLTSNPTYSANQRAFITNTSTVSEENYNKVAGYLNNLFVSKYLTTVIKSETLGFADGNKFNFNLGNPDEVEQFIQVFPTFLDNVKAMTVGDAKDMLQENIGQLVRHLELHEGKFNTRLADHESVNNFADNKFFQALKNTTNENGSFLYIPNIDIIDAGQKQALKFHLETNGGLGSSMQVFTPGGPISYAKLKQMILTYALITSKGKIGKYSFIDMIDPATRELLLNYYKQGFSVGREQVNDSSIAYALTSVLPTLKTANIPNDIFDASALKTITNGEDAGRMSLRDGLDTYYIHPSTSVDQLPKFIKMYGRNDSGYKPFELIFDEKRAMYAYERIVSYHSVMNLNSNVSGFNEYVPASEKRVKIHAPTDIESLVYGDSIVDTYFPDKADGEEFHAISNIGKVTVFEEGNTRKIALRAQKNPFVNRAMSKTLIQNMITKLHKIFPEMPIRRMLAEEIAAEFGAHHENKAAFIRNGELIFNEDRFGLDTPVHEFGHIVLSELQRKNPNAYNTLVMSALELNNPIAELVRSTYPELSGQELGEEIFVSMLGVEGIESLKRMNTVASDGFFSLVNNFLGTIKNFFSRLFSSNEKTARQRIDEMDFSDTTVHEALLAIGDLFAEEMSFGMTEGEKNFISKSVIDLTPSQNNLFSESGVKYAKAAFYNNKTKIDSIGSLFNAITDSKFRHGYNSTEVTAVVKDARNYITARLKGREEQRSYRRKPWMKFMDTVLSDFNPETDRYFTLQEAVENGDFKGMNLTGVPTESILLIKRAVGDGTFQYTMINFSDKRHSLKYPGSRERVSGAFIDDRAAKYKGIDLDNDHQGHTMLMLGLVGMKMKDHAGTSTKLGNMYSIAYKGDTADSLTGEYFDRVINNLKGIASIDGFKGALSDDMKRLFNKEDLLERGSYRSAKVEYYKTWITSSLRKEYLSEDVKSLYSGLLFDINSKTAREDIKRVLIDRQNILLKKQTKENVNIYSDTEWVGQEFRVIGEALIELNHAEDIYLDRYDITKLRAFLNSPGKSGSPIFEKLYQAVTNAINDVRRKFFGDFKPTTEKLTKDLFADFREHDPYAIGKQYTIGNATEVFDPLYEKAMAKNTAGEKISVYTGMLWNKSSSEYKALRPAQKAYIDYMNKVNKEYVGVHLTGKTSIDGMIPLMNEDPAGIIASGFQDGKYVDAMAKGIGRWWNKTMNNSDYFLNPDDLNKQDMFLKFEHTFRNSAETKYGSVERLERLGLALDKSGSLKIIDESKNGRFERNLEYVMNFTAMNSLYKTEMEKEAMSTYHIAKTYLTVAQSHFGKNAEGTEMMLEDFMTRLVYNMNNKTKGFGELEKGTNLATGMMTAALLGLNVLADVKNTIGGLSITIAASMKNHLANKFGADSLYTEKDLLRASTYCFNPVNFDQVNAIMEMYGLTHMDYDSMLAPRNNVSGQKLFKHENLFWMNYRGDKMNRSLMFVAQMMHDKSFDAYYMEDGVLKYNEEKDGRFKGSDGKLIKGIIKDSLKKEHEGVVNGKMTRGYDNEIRNKLKLIADDMYGSYDTGNATGMQNYWITRAMLSFKKYLPNRIQQATDVTGQNNIMSTIVIKEKNGVRYAERVGSINEGIFQTFQFLISESWKNKKLVWSELTPSQKRNVAALTADTFSFAAMSYVFAEIAGAIWGDDDDRTDREKRMARMLDLSFREAYPLYDSRSYSVLQEPFVVTTYMGDLIENTYKMIAKGDEKATEYVLRNGPTGLPYRMLDILETFDPDEFE